MGNLVTSKIPAEVCSRLMDLAQGFETSDGESINYGNILDWADKANEKEIKEVQGKISDLVDLDFLYDEDEEALFLATDIIEKLKA